MSLLEVKNLKKSFGDNVVLKDISFNIEKGEVLSIIGPSGSGKSTLLRCITDLETEDSGEINFDGTFGLVFQNFNLLPRTSALENVMMPAYYAHPARSTKEIRKRALELIDLVGLTERMHHTPAQLSGGQQQRVAIARSLINNPGILLADEPTGNLDSTTSVEVMNMFRDLNRKQGITVIIVTHDPKTAAFTDRAINMCDGLIMEGVSDELSATLSK